MKLAQDLMTANPYTLTSEHSLQDAEQLMAQHQFRHLPIVDTEKKVIGLLTQKEILSEAFRITDRFGAQNLRIYLAKTPIAQCMSTELHSIQADMPLIHAAAELKKLRSGCLLITSPEGQLEGILSSKDFVRLAMELL